jgi:hypothetical protein
MLELSARHSQSRHHVLRSSRRTIRQSSKR